MKVSFIKAAVFLLSIGLVGCQTNTPQGNTALGAASGAVIGGAAGSLIGAGQVAAIGAGAIAGAIVGGAIGNSMDNSDNSAVVHVLDDNPSNQAYYWKNKKTGNKYKFVPISERITYKGYSDCRRYHSVAMIDGKKESTTAIACRMKDGRWKSV